MFAPFLLTLVLASAPADDPPDVVTLIGRLGSESFDDRVAAYKAVEHLGGAALPALRAAADTSDMRVRSRVLALIASIGRQVEADRFTRPTIIRLDFRTRPLSEIVDDLNDRYDLGLSLRLGPEPERGMMMIDLDGPDRLKELRAREIRIRAARPLPFWEAIDRLCEVGALRYGISPRRGFGTGRGPLVLMADRTGRDPVSDSGPFRVQITWAHPVFNHDFAFDGVPARRRAKPPGAGDLTVPLAVLPEPGLMLLRNGLVSITEATDDRGRSLKPRAPAEFDRGSANPSHEAMYEGDAIQVNAVFVDPGRPATAIRRLRGKVPVIAVARGSDPIVIPLKEGVLGRPYSTRDLTLVVDEVSLAPGAPAWVKVTVRVNRGDRATFARHDPSPPSIAAYNLGGVLEHLELHDADGRRLSHHFGSQGRAVDGDHYQLIAARVSEDGPGADPGTSKAPIPAELRYYPFVQTATEVPFDFRDIPMP